MNRGDPDIIVEEHPAHPASISLHQRILGDIKARILNGDWPSGFRLPTEMELTEQYSCSRMTVNKVLSQLAKSGLIERRRRAGSFVLQPRSQAAVLEIHDIRTEVEELGCDYGYRLCKREVRSVQAEDNSWLDTDVSNSVLTLEALHLASGLPFCHEERSINLAAVPEAKDVDFAVHPASEWLLMQIPWTTAEHQIRAEGAVKKVADALDIPVGTPCLVIERKTWNVDHPVTFVRLTYPGNIHSLVASFSPSR